MLRAIPYTSLWFGIVIWVIFGGSLLAAAVWWLYEDYLFAYDSKPATGIVERLYTTTSHGRHGSTTTHHIQYHYRVSDMTFGCHTSVSYATYYSLSVGEKIPILYIPAQIDNNRIDLPDERRVVRVTTWCLSIASLVVAIVGALVLRYYLRQNKLYRFLLASGVACEGIVDSVPYNLVGKARTARFYLTLTFRDSQGRTRTGQTGYLRIGDEVRWRAGKTVQVYFDPANSERFTVDLKRGPLNS